MTEEVQNNLTHNTIDSRKSDSGGSSNLNMI